MPVVDRKRLNQIKKELKSESTDDIHTVLSAIQALEQILQQELKRRKC
jgi:hypothetical protein